MTAKPPTPTPAAAAAAAFMVAGLAFWFLRTGPGDALTP